MPQPRVPGGSEERIDLPCGESLALTEIDLGVRELRCSCGDEHGVVTDVNPPDRFLPPFLVDVLREAVETTDEELGEFGTPHLMGIVMEEFPDRVVAADASEEPDVGYGAVWIADFPARRLHELIVELVIELMEHAVSHSDDASAVAEFEERMLEFDVSEFVARYREERELDEDDVYD
ncbi:MAG: DUF5815 family protein [Halobaculum sp.]